MASKTISKFEAEAREFVALCEETGFTIEQASGGVVTISMPIKRDCNEAFAEADMLCPIYSLRMVKPGSTWGTDGGSVGGFSAMRNGVYRMHRSGVSARVCAWINKLV